MNEQLVQTVYIPTKVEDELLLPETAYGFITEDNNIFQDKFNEEQILEQYPQRLGFKLLKPKEGIFFTVEEYNAKIKEVIEETLKNGVKKAKTYDADNYTTLIGDYQVDKDSILNTFEESYKKFKI